MRAVSRDKPYKIFIIRVIKVCNEERRVIVTEVSPDLNIMRCQRCETKAG